MNVRRTLAIAAAAMISSTVARAQSFNTGIGNVDAGYAVDGPAQQVDVTTTTVVTSFAMWLKTAPSQLATANQNVKFFIFDLGTNTKLWESTQAVTLTTSYALTSSSPLSLVLEAGKSYAFGVLGLSGNFYQTSQFTSGLSLAQNGMSVSPAGYMHFYAGTGAAGPTATGVRADRTLAIQITTEAASVVPEPSTYALLGTGLIGLVGVVARRRRTA